MFRRIFDVAIVGAGACGLACALNLKTDNIIIFDKKSGAKKLSITGNNRCNITNTLPFDEFLSSYGRNGKFLRDVFGCCFRDELIVWLNGLGVFTKQEEGRVYLDGITSRELAGILVNRLAKNVVFKRFEPVELLKKTDGIFRITTNRGSYYSKFVVLSCGGKSFPHTGSDGSCFRLAQSLGHDIVPPKPYETPFCCKGYGHLKGISFKDRQLRLNIGKKRFKVRGDFIFTHFGLSGPAIFELSAHDFDEGELGISFIDGDRHRLKERIHLFKGKLVNFLDGFLPKRIAQMAPFSNKRCSDLKKEELEEVLDFLFDFRVKVKKCGFNRAFLTSGGVNLKHVDPKTLKSKIVDGVFFCGEVLDIQGPIGGFNLQFAFSSGLFVARILNRLLLQ